MKCERCGSNLIINSKGVLECPLCDKARRKLILKRFELNDFVAYKVVSVTNLVVDDYLTAEEVTEYLNQGVEIQVV